MIDDDTRIWQGVRAHLDELGRMAPAPNMPRVRERADGRTHGVGRSLLLIASAAIAVLLGVVVIGEIRPIATAGTPAPSAPLSGSATPISSPVVSCGAFAPAECSAAASPVLSAAANLGGTVVRVDLGQGGVFCPTRGLLFEHTSCPGGGLPPSDGGTWIGTAVVTFAGTPDQAYFNLAKSGETIRVLFIALATPPPTLPQPSSSDKPVVVCSSPPVAPSTTLTCDNAVETALSALPAGYPPIGRIEFSYGGYCPPSARCAYVSPQYGIVIFRASAGGQDIFLRVVADATGTVSVLGVVAPYPPTPT